MKRRPRGFIQIADTDIVIYTRLLETVHDTIASHINLMQCLKHMSNQALDLVTQRRFTATNWPEVNRNNTYPLDLFISLQETASGIQTLGLYRLGKADLHFKNIPEKSQVWPMVGLTLASPNLDEALRLEGLDFVVTARTPRVLTIEPSPKRTDNEKKLTNPIDERVKRVRRSPAPKTFPQSPKKLPEYR